MRDNITLRNANHGDLEAIIKIYREATEAMESTGIYQWDHLYPNEEILREDVTKNEMFLGEIGNEIVSLVVLNHEYDSEYIYGNWQYTEDAFCVIHRLCVNPAHQGKGIGKRTLNIIEEYLRSKNYKAIRLDAFSNNSIAVKMYEKLGYKRVGEVNWPKGLFYLYEKLI